ncbi:MAG: hypothetical protein M5U34_38785 [Chloroflexi bacterium]|nr:hypothetical protein [Chloroflexota bacterium]
MNARSFTVLGDFRLAAMWCVKGMCALINKSGERKLIPDYIGSDRGCEILTAVVLKIAP